MRGLNLLTLTVFTYLTLRMADQMGRCQGSGLNLHGRSVILWTGRHSAVSWRTQRGLPLQQLQDGLNVGRKLRLQPEKQHQSVQTFEKHLRRLP